MIRSRTNIPASTAKNIFIGTSTGAALGAVAGSIGAAIYNGDNRDNPHSLSDAALQGLLGGMVTFGGIAVLSGEDFFKSFIYQHWNTPERICVALVALLAGLQYSGQMGLNILTNTPGKDPDLNVTATAKAFAIGSAIEALILVFVTTALQLILAKHNRAALHQGANETLRPNPHLFLNDKSEGLISGATYGVVAGALAGSIGVSLYNSGKDTHHSVSTATLQGVVGGVSVYGGIGLVSGATLFKKLINKPYENSLRAFLLLLVVLGGLQYAAQMGHNILQNNDHHQPDLSINESAEIFAIGGGATLLIFLAISKMIEPCLKDISWFKEEENTTSSLQSSLLANTV